MIEGIAAAVLASLLAFGLSGAKSSAYLLYFLGYVPFVTLDASAGGLVSEAGFGAGNVLFKLAFRVLATGGMLLLAFRRRETLGNLARVQALPVLFFFAWALLSIHRAQSPWISFIRLGELLAFFLAGVVLFAEAGRFHGPRAVARWHCIALAQILLVALYFEQTNPELAKFVSADGISRLGHKFLNSNTLGFACVAVGLWATVELREGRERARALFFERGVPALMLVLACYVLLGARSRTAMITMAVGQLVIWLPLPLAHTKRRSLFVLAGFAALVAVLLNAETIMTWFLRGESVEVVRSGTGRTGLWVALLQEQLPKAPFLGAGYLMLSDQGLFLHAGAWWNNAHNTYLFALIATGLPGALAVLAIALWPWLALFKRSLDSLPDERPFWLLLLAMQSVVLVAGITGFGIAGYPNPAMCFHYALYAYVLFGRAPSAEPAWRVA